jgi:hypothetical protein
MHRGRGQAHCFGHAPRAPVGSGLRFAQSCADYRLFLRRGDPSWTPSPRPVPQTVQAATRIPSPPQTYRSLGNLEPFRQRARILSPAALPSTMRARVASPCAMLCVRNHASNWARSASLISACTICEALSSAIAMPARRLSPMSTAMSPNRIPVCTRRTPVPVRASRICGSRTDVLCKTFSVIGTRCLISREVAKPRLWKRRFERRAHRLMCFGSTSRTCLRSMTVRCSCCAGICISHGAEMGHPTIRLRSQI